MINLIDIQVGDTVTTRKGTVGVCTENMGDGQWVEIEAEGAVELVHSQDVKTVEPKA